MPMLANTKVAFESDDQILWPYDPSGKFIIKSYCREIFRWLNQDVPARAIWKCKAPTRACYLAWAATRRKAPRATYLKGETWSWLVGIQSVLQRKRRLTAFFGFSHCQWVSDFWRLSLSLMGASGVKALTIRDVLVA